ncbi:hypothetical protein JTB14_023574 [Gonioctena quinquepunctata]|nr:hypothetical protein JTB14_023574 [Gonioctena quinquepunctata]
MRDVKDRESPNEPTTEEHLITKKVIEFIAGIEKSNKLKRYLDKQESSIASESELYDVWLTCLRKSTIFVDNSKADSKFQECENTEDENLDVNSNTELEIDENENNENYSYTENISLDISALPIEFMNDLNEDEINIVEESGTNYEIYDENYNIEKDVTIVREDCTRNPSGENNPIVVDIEEQWKEGNRMKHIGETNDTRGSKKHFMEYETSNTEIMERSPVNS